MGNIAAIDSPSGVTPDEIFEQAKRLVIAGHNEEDIADALMIAPRRARALMTKVNAALTVDNFSWSKEQVAAFSRAAKIQMAAEGMASDDPKHRKVALEALRSLDEEVKGTDIDRQSVMAPTSLKIDVQSIIDTGQVR